MTRTNEHSASDSTSETDARLGRGLADRRRFLAGGATLAGAALAAAAVHGPDRASAQDAQAATPDASEAATPWNDAAQEAFDATFRHHTTMVDGVRLHYVMGGQGDPLVLLHGWPQTWYEWHRLMPALAERYTVIAPDLRGLGDSGRPESGYDARTVAADIAGLVEQLGVGPVFLAGHDLGGWIAYAYAAANRDAVRALALMEIIPADDAILGYTTLAPGPGLWHFTFHVQPDLPEALTQGRERMYLSTFYAGAYNPSAIDAATIDEYVRCYASPGGMRAGFAYYRALFTNIEQTREDAQTPLAMPVLAVGGEISFGDAVGNAWAPYATDLRAEVVPESGHWLAEEQPGRVADLLLSFFGES